MPLGGAEELVVYCESHENHFSCQVKQDLTKPEVLASFTVQPDSPADAKYLRDMIEKMAAEHGKIVEVDQEHADEGIFIFHVFAGQSA